MIIGTIMAVFMLVVARHYSLMVYCSQQILCIIYISQYKIDRNYKIIYLQLEINYTSVCFFIRFLLKKTNQTTSLNYNVKHWQDVYFEQFHIHIYICVIKSINIYILIFTIIM